MTERKDGVPPRILLKAANIEFDYVCDSRGQTSKDRIEGMRLALEHIDKYRLKRSKPRDSEAKR